MYLGIFETAISKRKLPKCWYNYLQPISLYLNGQFTTISYLNRIALLAVLIKKLSIDQSFFTKSKMEDKKLEDRANLVIPNGMYGHQSIKRFLPLNWPQFYQKAEGCHLWDVDGKKYIDYLCAYGPIILGKSNLNHIFNSYFKLAWSILIKTCH